MMRILLLTRSFNSLTQRLYCELVERRHEVSVEFDIHPDITREAIALFRPDLVLAPFLKRAIPDDVWQHNTCLVLHPGPRGDRGPAALDWAILNQEETWGVSVIEAREEMDAGPLWATADFPMRAAPKSSIYRHEVTESGVACLLEALARFESGAGPLALVNEAPDRGWQGPVPADLRRIDWESDATADILRKVRAADGQPGALDTGHEREWRLYGAEPAPGFGAGKRPGQVLGTRDEAICRATVDSAVWVRQVRIPQADNPGFKLPATRALSSLVTGLPDFPAPLVDDHEPFQEIRYHELGRIGILEFDFYNGAMNTDRCRKLAHAYDYARQRPTRAIILRGGLDFWSNGMDLNCIEAADSPADASWRNINAMDDLCRRIIETDDRLTVAALHGNAGAGGVFLALATDHVVARRGIVLNPHYKSMGNLYGSEYWTYVLPRRVGSEQAESITQRRLPMLAAEARALGLVDELAEGFGSTFFDHVLDSVGQRVTDPGFGQFVAAKRARRAGDEAKQPLSAYRDAELARMRMNFYGFDPSYHVARYRFVTHEPHAWTPLYLAPHRSHDGGRQEPQAKAMPA